jgi:antitoxin ParD1/3/4
MGAGYLTTGLLIRRELFLKLEPRDRAVNDWLQEKGVPACDATKTDLSRAVSAGQVRAALSTEHGKALAKKHSSTPPSSSSLSIPWPLEAFAGTECPSPASPFPAQLSQPSRCALLNIGFYK